LSGKRKPLHPVKAQDVIKALVRLGFAARHTKGAHVFLKHPDGRTTTIPVHPGEEIDRRLLHKIAADVGIHPEELMYLIDERWHLPKP
jgi:predicted RNA binding protein YcfA (HicA-like mRNA interferase family)